MITKNPTDNNLLITIPGKFSDNMGRVLLSVARGNTTSSTISKDIGIARGNAYRTLKALKSKELVSQITETKMWMLTDFGAKIALELTKNQTPQLITKSSGRSSTDNTTDNKPTKSLRGHALRVRFPIKKAPRGWKESPKDVFEKRNISYRKGNLKNSDDVSMVINEVFIRATTRNFIAHFTGIRTDRASELMLLLKDPIRKIRKDIGRMFPDIELKETNVVEWGEIAHEEDIMADLVDNAGESYVVIKHKDGRPRVKFDKSMGPIEIEFMHPGMFDGDSEQWQRQLIGMLDSPYEWNDLGIRSEMQEHMIEELKQNLHQASMILNGSVKNQAFHSENLRSHVMAIRQLAENSNAQRDVIDDVHAYIKRQSDRLSMESKMLLEHMRRQMEHSAAITEVITKQNKVLEKMSRYFDAQH